RSPTAGARPWTRVAFAAPTATARRARTSFAATAGRPSTSPPSARPGAAIPSAFLVASTARTSSSTFRPCPRPSRRFPSSAGPGAPPAAKTLWALPHEPRPHPAQRPRPAPPVEPMFLRLVADSFSRRPRHKLLTGAALALGMSVATAALSVSLDVGDRLAREFRSLGANLLVTPQADS